MSTLCFQFHRLPCRASRRASRRLWGALCCLLLHAAVAGALPVDLATGLTGGIGTVRDEVHNNLYFVDFNAGTLKRIHLTPDCEAGTVPCVTDTVTSGFSHPQDVAVNAPAGTGYVTTRDDPGTTGALWRVDLTTGARSLVTFNLGAPHQIALDPPTNTAYVVGFSAGKVWRIDLTTGVHVAVASGLASPVGLTISADRTRGYVTEQGAGGRLAELDLILRTRIRNVVTGLTSPFYLAWTDPARIALYVAERAPANRVSRVDLIASTSVPIVTGLPSLPSGLAVNLPSGSLYVAADPKVVRVVLADLPLEPVFLGVGNVPSTSIDSHGYANTVASYFFHVVDAPFGGTLNVFGNLNNFRGLGATHYRVLKSTDGGASFTPLVQSWTAYLWNTAAFRYDPVLVAPVTPAGRYQIPAEYPTAPQRWYPSFLMMQWPTSDNGLVRLKVELYSSLAAPLPLPSPGGNSMTLLIDNTPPQVELTEIRRHGTTTVVSPCEIVSPPVPNSFDFLITASDTSGHMLSYGLGAVWGRNQSAAILSDSYSSHVNPTQLWNGVTNAVVPPAGWAASCNCAHTFFLDGWKRTIDGYSYILHSGYHQSVTINNTGVSCP
jgi:DNA-binding beta-propeller fold protein YncE